GGHVAAGLLHVAGIGRIGDGRQDPDDRHRDHQLDQRETLLLVHVGFRMHQLLNSSPHDTRRVGLPPGGLTVQAVGMPPLESPITSLSPMMMGAVGMPARIGSEPIGSSLPLASVMVSGLYSKNGAGRLVPLKASSAFT